jgi:hypothetical protein
VKTGCNLAESSKKDYGSKKGCFANDDCDDDLINRTLRPEVVGNSGCIFPHIHNFGTIWR